MIDITEKSTDFKPKSSVRELEVFIESSVHADFVGELEVRIEDLRDVLERASSKEFHTVQGAILLVRQFQTLFEDLMENKKSDLRKDADDEEEK